MFAYIFNWHGEPLMPCQPRQSPIAAQRGKAKVVKMVPFTLQLLYGSSGYTQAVSLGIDAGTQHIGVSAMTEKPCSLKQKSNRGGIFRKCLLPASVSSCEEKQARHATERPSFSIERNRRVACSLRGAQSASASENIHLVHQILPVAEPPLKWPSSIFRRYALLRLKVRHTSKGHSWASGIPVKM